MVTFLSPDGASGPVTNTALLFVDLTNEVVHSDGTLGGDLAKVATPLLERARELVSWARQHRVPVIWMRTAFRPGYIDAARGMRATAHQLAGRLIEGSWGTQLIDGIGREPQDIVITKKRPSAFIGTELGFILRNLQIRRVILAGTSTNWAIESTARDAESRDYEVVVPRDATGARVGHLHEGALASIASRYGQVTDVGAILSGQC